MATGAFTTSASGVSPAKRMSALWPESSPPLGAASAVVIPLARATGSRSLWGCTATQALACGLTSPTSLTSFPPATLPISVRPRVVSASMSPG